MTTAPRLTREAVNFLAELRDNNNRTWFLENKERAEEVLLAPGRELVTAVGQLLRKKRPDIVADPRTDRSIYRLNRDTRFSRDKTPYKTHLALWWWEGGEGRLECPGFYVHLTPESLGVSVGCYRFSETGLAGWRKALLDPKRAAVFRRVVKDFTETTGAAFSEPEYKRMPAGLDPAHPMAGWLRHKGFYTWTETAHPGEIFGPDAAEYIFGRFTPGLKLHDWLVKALGFG